MEFLGINNDNEFYTEHYLSELFKKDIKDVLKSWRKEVEIESKTPYQQLGRLSRKYFGLHYRAIIVDEAQDFGNVEFKFIRQMIPESRTEDEMENKKLYLVRETKCSKLGRRFTRSRRIQKYMW